MIVLDSGPIIAMTANNLLWAFKDLKRLHGSDLLMPLSVKRELVDRGLETQQFKFEAIQVGSYVQDGTFRIIDDERVKKKTNLLLRVANRILSVGKRNLRIVQRGEMEAVATALVMGADAVVVDERTTRTMIESPNELRGMMQHRLHKKLRVDRQALNRFQNEVKGIFIMRSIELVMVAYEQGLLDRFIIDIPNARTRLLESLLWGMKTEGCSVTVQEINELVRSAA